MDKIYIVMNYVEHDLKSLMETMKQPFLPGSKKKSFEPFSIFVEIEKRKKTLVEMWKGCIGWCV